MGKENEGIQKNGREIAKTERERGNVKGERIGKECGII